LGGSGKAGRGQTLLRPRKSHRTKTMFYSKEIGDLCYEMVPLLALDLQVVGSEFRKSFVSPEELQSMSGNDKEIHFGLI
jgi:hypothetical protein